MASKDHRSFRQATFVNHDDDRKPSRYRPRDPGYGYYQGSSAAAARVAGALALLASKYPDASAAELEERLLMSVEPFAPGQCDPSDGQ